MSQTSGKFSAVENALAAQLDRVLALASRVDARLVASLREAALYLLLKENGRAEGREAKAIGMAGALFASHYVPGTLRKWTSSEERQDAERLGHFQKQKAAVKSASPQVLMLNLEAYQKARSERRYDSKYVPFEFMEYVPLRSVDENAVGGRNDEGPKDSANGRK